MMLVDLNPKSSAINGGFLVFDCPCGACAGRIRIPIAPTKDGRGLSWSCTGEYPNITLSPSINAGCWHGWIVDGRIQANA